MNLLRRVWRQRMFQVALAMFVFGSGPLIAVMLAAQWGFTDDPHPNPVGLGILAFFTFYPSLIMMAVALWRARSRTSERA